MSEVCGIRSIIKSFSIDDPRVIEKVRIVLVRKKSSLRGIRDKGDFPVLVCLLDNCLRLLIVNSPVFRGICRKIGNQRTDKADGLSILICNQLHRSSVHRHIRDHLAEIVKDGPLRISKRLYWLKAGGIISSQIIQHPVDCLHGVLFALDDSVIKGFSDKSGSGSIAGYDRFINIVGNQLRLRLVLFRIFRLRSLRALRKGLIVFHGFLGSCRFSASRKQGKHHDCGNQYCNSFLFHFLLLNHRKIYIDK